ncbi:MAG: YlbF family regulator [Peptococcaceae bacterium]|nr:YlbF family regulator [Peptococcaceae bacterium]
MTIQEKAVELGKLIAASSEFQAVRQAERSLRDDAEGYKIVEDLQALQKSLERMQMSGRQPTGEDLNALREAEDRAMQNMSVRGFFEANRNFYRLLEHVNAKIQEGISGRPAPGCGPA